MASRRPPVVTASASGLRPADISIGYESPNEDNQPNFFLTPSPTPSIYQSNQPPQTARPALIARPSYIAAVPPERSSPTKPLVSNQSSLNQVVAKAEKLPLGAKVTLKDRIACYQWTYFTMVCENLSALLFQVFFFFSLTSMVARLSASRRPWPPAASPTSSMPVCIPAHDVAVPMQPPSY